ncbi:hypothetical protein K439DRAFT_571465 [Ramaria rubella]|nr:hypothetical protein K439DRAFT_571465 [Ramaria rubella]
MVSSGKFGRHDAINRKFNLGILPCGPGVCSGCEEFLRKALHLYLQDSPSSQALNPLTPQMIPSHATQPPPSHPSVSHHESSRTRPSPPLYKSWGEILRLTGMWETVGGCTVTNRQRYIQELIHPRYFHQHSTGR